jgi:hypothetical protein
MIGHHSIKSILVDLIRWNRQLFLSHCLSSLTDTTKADNIFVDVPEAFSLDTLAGISQSLVIEMIEESRIFLQLINILLYHNRPDYILFTISKKLLYDYSWLLFYMDKVYSSFVTVSPEIIFCSLITRHFDLDMPENLFIFFKTKLINKHRNVAMLSNSNSFLSNFEFVIHKFYGMHNMSAIFSEYVFR